MHHALARLTDPVSPVFGVVSAAAFGALSLVDPAALSPARRRAYRAGVATTTAWWAGVTTDRDRTAFVPAHVVAALVAGGAVWALAGPSEALDARVVSRLHATGVRRPRRWLAEVSAAGVLASFAADRAAAGTEEGVWVDELLRARPVTPQVRQIIEGILQATDTPDAQVLLAQLDVAQESYYDTGADVEAGTGGFSPMVEFEVPDEVVRVVPHSQVHPVQARFRASGGIELQVSLQLHRGKLAHLTVEYPDQDEVVVGDALVEELVDRWPDPAQLRYVLDGSDGASHPLP
ncbi:hypothetical protein [Kocuria sp. U4B]